MPETDPVRLKTELVAPDVGPAVELVADLQQGADQRERRGRTTGSIKPGAPIFRRGTPGATLSE
jgi:hypothetical protein